MGKNSKLADTTPEFDFNKLIGLLQNRKGNDLSEATEASVCAQIDRIITAIGFPSHRQEVDKDEKIQRFISPEQAQEIVCKLNKLFNDTALLIKNGQENGKEIQVTIPVPCKQYNTTILNKLAIFTPDFKVKRDGVLVPMTLAEKADFLEVCERVQQAVRGRYRADDEILNLPRSNGRS